MWHALIEILFNFDRRTQWAGAICAGLLLLSLAAIAIIRWAD